MVGPGWYRVEAALEGDGWVRQTAKSEFDFALTPQDREDLRWCLEDYLQHAVDPAPRVVARVEGQMAVLGTNLSREGAGVGLASSRLPELALDRRAHARRDFGLPQARR